MRFTTLLAATLQRRSEKQHAQDTTTPGQASSAAQSLFNQDPEKDGYAEQLQIANSNDRHQSFAQAKVDEPNWPKGWRPWVTLVACFFLMFNSWGIVNAYGTFASYYKDVLLPDDSALIFNLFGATDCFMVLGLSGFVGRFLDAGYHRILLGTGTLFVTLGFMLLSVVNGDGECDEGNIALIELTHGIVAGFGMACFFVSSSQIASTWFQRRKSLAIGIVASGASISGLIYPIMLRYITTSLGFNNAVRCVAAVIGATALFSFFFARPNPKHVFRKPKTMLTWSVYVDPEAFRYAPFCWFTASIAFLFLGFYPVFFNLEEWAASKGFGYKEGIARTAAPGDPKPLTAGLATFYMLAIMNAMSTFGRIGAAYLSDHFGAVLIHTVVTSVCSLLTLILWTLTPNFNVSMVFIAFFGAFSGAVIGLPPASMAYILGKAPHRQAKLGQWTGMMYTVAAVPSMVGPIIVGYLITKYETYVTVQMWSGACLFLSACCMGVTWFYKRREGDDGVEVQEEEQPASKEERQQGRGANGGGAGFVIERTATDGSISSRTVSSGVSSVPPVRHEGEGEAARGRGRENKDDDEIKEVKYDDKDASE